MKRQRGRLVWVEGERKRGEEVGREGQRRGSYSWENKEEGRRGKKECRRN